MMYQALLTCRPRDPEGPLMTACSPEADWMMIGAEDEPSTLLLAVLDSVEVPDFR